MQTARKEHVSGERAIHLEPADLQAFERRLHQVLLGAKWQKSSILLRPEAARGARIVGFGEISVVFALDAYPELVFKRVAGFQRGEVEGYRAMLGEYVRTLEARGVAVAPVRAIEVEGAFGPVVYLAQRRVDPETLGHRVLQDGTDGELARMLESVLAHVGSVLGHGSAVGLDAQLSNWSLSSRGTLTYLDLSTPLMRQGGEERLDLAFVMRSLPGPLRWALEITGKKRSMLDRYYDRRKVAMDIVANFIKEGRADRVPLGVEIVNRWLGDLDRPLTVDEVRADYRDDARTWAFLQWIKRPDRFLRTKVLRRRYDWLLAPRIDRHLRRESAR